MKIEETKKATPKNKEVIAPIVPEEVKAAVAPVEEPEDLTYARKLSELKKQYRRVYVTEIGGEKVLWRPLKRSEYKEVLNMKFPEDMSDEDRLYDRETFIAEHVILYPEGAAEDIALAAEIITGLCMEKSGFVERNTATSKEA